MLTHAELNKNIIEYLKAEAIMGSNVILDKSKGFAIRIINLYKYLIDTKKEYILSKQILRCGTAIGANIRETINAQSRADFVSKMSIALKEADDTLYWLELLYETNFITTEQFKSMSYDCT